MATTTNYSWTTPDDTALVKDGAAAIRTLGSSVDTTVKALNPGTTAGDLDYYTSSTAKSRIGIGTSGQVLTVNGSGLPAWATSSAGGMTLLSTTTLTGTSVVVSSIDQTYNDLFILITDISFSADDYMIIRPNSATSQLRNATYSTVSGTMVTATSAWQASQQRAIDQSNSEGVFAMTINNYANTSSYKLANWNASFLDSAAAINAGYWGFGQYSVTTAITSLQFRPDGAASFDGGTLKIYGVK